MLKRLFPIFCLIVFLALPIVAQDVTVENFGRVLLTFEVSTDDDDFRATHIAAPSDLSQFYVSGNDGMIYKYDGKGNLEDVFETESEVSYDDFAIDIDNRLYVAHSGSIFLYEEDGTFIRELPGSLSTQYYNRLVTNDDGTFYATTFFGGDIWHHKNADGSNVSLPREDFFENLIDDSPGIFDHFIVGLDGFFYFYQQSDGTFYQFDEFGEIYNRYEELIEQFTLRDTMLVDGRGQILVGGNNVVEIYGEKELLVNELALEGSGFVTDMQFASNGQLVVLQGGAVTVLQYGPRDEDGE